MTVSEYIDKFNIDFEYFEKTYENLPIKILKYLQDINKGIFVEIGAHNGIFQSNTKILEDCGWDGLLIEPSLELFNECKKNRNCHVENYALVSDNHIGNSVLLDNTGEMINEKKGILSMGPEKSGSCPATSFNKLYQKFKFKKIDFMSIDVEGYELEVLNGIDFLNINISNILIEINYNYYTLEEVEKKLSTFGYQSPINISNFSKDNCPTWPGTHQDFLFIKK